MVNIFCNSSSEVYNVAIALKIVNFIEIKIRKNFQLNSFSVLKFLKINSYNGSSIIINHYFTF
jgi:hypothetical protein